MWEKKILHLLFDRIILRHPYLTILVLFLIIAPLAYSIRDFKLDASAETLVLENDEDLKYERIISSRYGKQTFLVVTFTPEGDLFSSNNLQVLASLRDDLKTLENETSVISILDVPLLQSPPLKLSELTSELPTLSSPQTNIRLAINELSQSPLYQNLLLSEDAKTTAILVNFENDTKYLELLSRKNELVRKQASGLLTVADRSELKRVKHEFDMHRDKRRKQSHNTIEEIRNIMTKYQKDGELFLGGLSMIADDMITYIKDDLKIFGVGVLLFLILALGGIFRRLRWIFLPMICCLVSVICMIGLLGWFGWEVTVVSSNFISLQIIITLAIIIHLIVKYREQAFKFPQKSNNLLILNSLILKFNPCLFTVLTTIAGFASLVFCKILPVINFAWMMITGLIVSLLLTFLLFPAILILLPKEKLRSRKPSHFSFTLILARFTDKNEVLIIIVSIAVLVLSFMGITKLKVENSFINYFKKDSEIYQGLKLIDRSLGGTTSLDVIVDFDNADSSSKHAEIAMGQDDFFDEFEELELAENEDKYWFTAKKVKDIKKVHNYLRDFPETGKVLSMASTISIAEQLNKNKPLDSFELALLYNETPEKFKDLLLKPYISVEHSQSRFWVRIIDSKEELRRDKLLKTIKSDLTKKLGFKQENVQLTGLLVLYNNMLQSLFDSQIKTLSITILIVTMMFFLLFKSFKIAFLAMIPNILPISVVLGIMGWFNIPLDMMTITIAAIGIGIAVDDTIHYIHHFKVELSTDYDYKKTMYRCHGSIGFAMYYTTITIIIGFSILTFSNFIPNIYFGLLTGLTMLVALFADLTLLPVLLIIFKPFGKNVR